ncbi:hypothetical protein SAMN04515671_0163 [Nakamurella panacisegetis]|uniref:Uncharacterized protein n=1 Tax=Nakamurella panacisegetis TaxID=1090615 RepID=A0A1H0HPX2_9ACTN|nr:hypothetical protein [Nakamurella panacisegetis]SDO21242.1 hypothetical protein SAMN04515671_0163 [Nakamurella panacisegetis]
MNDYIQNQFGTAAVADSGVARMRVVGVPDFAGHPSATPEGTLRPAGDEQLR